MSKRDKPHINLIIIGHVDHGKSTSVGHLFYDAGAIPEKQLRDFEEEAKALGGNAIVDSRFATSYIMSNVAEILVYGTAVYVE